MTKLDTTTLSGLAALGASLLLAAAPASAAKPGGGGGTDPCAAPSLDFPAFTYWQPSGRAQQIYVADATGKCSRAVYKKGTNLGGTVGAGAFSYPVAGTTDVGRVIWPEGGAIYGITFTVTGAVIALDAKQMIYAGAANAMELSKDGATLYVSLDPGSNTGAAKIRAINISDGTSSDVYVGPADGSWFYTIAASEDGVLFVEQVTWDYSDSHQVVRIESSCTDPSCATVLAVSAPGTSAPMYPAASFADTRLVYSYYLPGLNNCWQLQVIPDTGGAILNSGQPRYGTRSSWYGGQVLTNGRKPPDGAGKCWDTGMVTQIDPDTSAETELVKGYDPDGR